MQRGIRIGNRGATSVRRPVPARSITIAIGAATVVVAAVAVCDTPSDTPYRVLAGPGHGRGLSQHGAFDSAQRGDTAEKILAHYYPGATLGTVGPTTIGVRLTEQDDATLDVYADAGLRVAGREVGRGQAVHLTALPDGGANVVVTIGCDGDVQWQGSTRDPWVYPLHPAPGRPSAEHLTLCGGTAYRGALGLASEDGAARTVNRVHIEDYLLGLVPAEVQANWVDKGAREALRAQAIAARSYAIAEQRYPYAQTCDTTDCQVYPGTAAEDPRAAEAVASTAGTVLLRDGRILRAEYSAAPDGGAPADIQTFEVGPTPAELSVGRIPTDPRVDTSAALPNSEPQGNSATVPGGVGAGTPGEPRQAAVPGGASPAGAPGSVPAGVPGGAAGVPGGASPASAPGSVPVGAPGGASPAGVPGGAAGAPGGVSPVGVPGGVSPASAPGSVPAGVPGGAAGVPGGAAGVPGGMSSAGVPGSVPAGVPGGVSPGGVPGVESAIDSEYRRIGGAGSAVGAPLGPEMRLPEEAGTYRLFTNGVIIATPSLGAQVVDFTTLMQMVPEANVPDPDAASAPNPNGETYSGGADSGGADLGLPVPEDHVPPDNRELSESAETSESEGEGPDSF
ncbi:SpoIID/LytB domain-containing protein [Nocardia bovistercoris]|uniref:SpoIID/LytB domain-containing protein n=1 Tax=Nocardia bovistercoris TaxID=2785916 RepID=UPI001E340C03|nr:SpoIID/LytB domain-containing protein [Nocardia bovistercoris]